MKKLTITLAILTIALGSIFAAHWTPAWSGQNPYLPMNIYVYGAQVNSVALEAGDEIGVFDGSTLVGAAALTGPITTNVPIIVSIAGGGVPGSATSGHFITFKVWKSPSGPEYAYPGMSVQFAPPYISTFSAQGTSHVMMLSYETPSASVTNALIAGPNANVSFPGTGLTITSVTAATAGDLTGYYIPSSPLDLSFNGTPPSNVSIYEWDFDTLSSGLLLFTIQISLDITNLAGVYAPYDDGNIKLYQRDIHGTGPFTEVTGISISPEGILTATLSSLGNLILGSNSPDDPLPVELSSFTAVMTTGLDAVTLTWVTQSESNLTGYYVFRSTTDQLAEATQINTLIPATNTSQPVTYNYSDNEIFANTTYWYWLQAVELNGTSGFHGPVSLTVPAGGPDTPPVIPLMTDISNAYPNPFAASLHVNYGLKEGGYIVMHVTNSKGQVVRRLFSGEKAAGSYNLNWDGRDDAGKQCSSGMYFLRMTVGNKAYSRKIILVK